MARPNTLTPEVHERIVKLLRQGNYLETAAGVAGVNGRTARRWMTKGKRGEGEPYESFAHDAERAINEAEARDVLTISRAAAGDAENGIKPDWRAVAWRLERRSPERWGQTIRVEVQRRIEDLLDSLEPHMSREAYQELLHAIACVEGVDTKADEGGAQAERPDVTH